MAFVGFEESHEVRQLFDYQVYNEIGMSERSYTRLKGKTFLDLAYAPNEVVYKAPV